MVQISKKIEAFFRLHKVFRFQNLPFLVEKFWTELCTEIHNIVLSLFSQAARAGEDLSLPMTLAVSQVGDME